jgi:uncharacterized membrane protein YfcA
MISDPWFYAAAIPAVMLTGLSKGGFGGTLSLLALPLLALVISPVQAAGIMLPILVAMDVVAVWNWRRIWSRENLVMLVPGAIAGTAIGWATASLVSDGHIRLMVGLLGLTFTANYFFTTFLSRRELPAPSTPSWPPALLWGTLSGFTSFISHVGGPPLQIYLLPQRLSKELFAGTFTMFFAFMNAIKIVPFWALGQLSPTNLAASAALAPFAVGATFFGVWLVKRVSSAAFFAVIYAVLAVVSVKLVYDGLTLMLAR